MLTIFFAVVGAIITVSPHPQLSLHVDGIADDQVIPESGFTAVKGLTL